MATKIIERLLTFNLTSLQLKLHLASLYSRQGRLEAAKVLYADILSSGYLNKNDAVLVQSSLKENFQIESELFSVRFESFSVHGNFDSDEGKVLSKALNLFLETYKFLLCYQSQNWKFS